MHAGRRRGRGRRGEPRPRPQFRPTHVRRLGKHLLLAPCVAHAGVVRRRAGRRRPDLAEQPCPDTRVAEAEPYLVGEPLRQLLDRRLANSGRVGRLDVYAGALDDVQAGGPRHTRDGLRVDPDALDRSRRSSGASRSAEKRV